MGYMQEFEHNLRTIIERGEPTDSIVNWVKEELYKSYKNGKVEGQTKPKKLSRKKATH